MFAKLAISAARTQQVLGARAAQGARVAPKLLSAAPQLPAPALRRLTLNAGQDVRAANRTQAMAAHPIPTARRRAAETVSALEETHPAQMFDMQRGFGQHHELPFHSPQKAEMLFGTGSQVHDPSALLSQKAPAVSGTATTHPLVETSQLRSLKPEGTPQQSVYRPDDKTPRPVRLKQASPLDTPSTGTDIHSKALQINPLQHIESAFMENDRHVALGTDTSSKIAAAYKLQGRVTFRGLPISIETAKGNYRHWTDAATGEAGKTRMRFAYGYIRRTKGLDGDHVDVFVGPNEKAESVYVIMTNKAPDFKEPDEEKCMLGFNTAAEAKDAFMVHYNKAGFFRSMKVLSFTEFSKRVFETFDGGRKKIAYDATNQFEDYSVSPEQVLAPVAPYSARAPWGSTKSPRARIDESFGMFPQENAQQTPVVERGS